MVVCAMRHSARVQTKVHDINPMRDNIRIYPNIKSHRKVVYESL